MQAVIMAGSKGTRLASVTKDLPKPMVRIAGRLLLEHQIENLRESGVTDIILVISRTGAAIREYFGNGAGFGVAISCFVEEEPLGTAGALAELKDRLESNFLLVFGDPFVNVSWRRLLAFHTAKQADITLFVHPNSHPYDSDLVITDAENRVTGWCGKNIPRTADYRNLVNAGLYVVRRDAVAALAPGQRADLEKDVIVPQIAHGKVFAYRSAEYVKDIGTPERLQRVIQDYRSGICEKRNRKHRQKCIFPDRDGTINRCVGFLCTAGQMELEDGAAEAVRRINESECLAIVITSQPVIARGACSPAELEAIHDRLSTLLGREGAYLDGLYFCPHYPDKGYAGEVPELKIDCSCRKPKTGMLLRAEQDFGIDLADS